MFSISFRKQRDEKKENNLLTLITSSLRQQRTLVLCLHRVIQTRFLTNQRACFLRTVFLSKPPHRVLRDKVFCKFPLEIQWNPDLFNSHFCETYLTITCSPPLRQTVNFIANFSNYTIFQTNFHFPWWFEKSEFHWRFKNYVDVKPIRVENKGVCLIYVLLRKLK